MYLENIDSPLDVHALPAQALEPLCAELREAIIASSAAAGGHVGPNLGIVELTVALHRVFTSPEDKLVFDVSHQTYAHKMLTGRAASFADPAHYGEASGFANPAESAHDLFAMGHTSTSVSLACGLAKARDLAGEHHNVVAVIGDGSLSGGLAFEGLDNAAELASNLIIVVNDNEWSIAADEGGLYRGLARLRETGGTAPDNLFRALGLEYRYLEEGNDVHACISALAELRDHPRPVVLHVHTTKGKGYAPAEHDPESWHHVGSFERATGTKLAGGRPSGGIVTTLPKSYADLTGEYLLERMEANKGLVAISSATPYMMGFTPERRTLAGQQFIDVGIAEEHAVTFACGLARAEATPVWGVYGTFLQRTYDQLWHDACLNALPITILVFGSSAYGTTDATHLGFYDIAMLSDMPGLVYLAPTCLEEYRSMLAWSLGWREGPVAIRVPGAGVVSRPDVVLPSEGYASGEVELVREGEGAALVALGATMPLAEAAANKLREQGVLARIINPRRATCLNEQALARACSDCSVVVTLEDGVVGGGFGEHVARLFGATEMRVRCFGLPHGFPDRYDPKELLASCGMTPDALAAEIVRLLSGPLAE